jgi:hypothetical protein
MKWKVATTHLHDEDGHFLGIARADGTWEAQEFRDGVDWTKRGRSKPSSLKAAQKGCEAFLKKNAKERKAYYAVLAARASRKCE